MALYQNMYVHVNGSLLAEAVTVEMSLDSDIPDVMTMGRNWAGITKAPIVRGITVQSAIPLPGVEFDAEKAMLKFEEIEVMVQESDSGKKCTSKGYIVAVPRSGGVGANSTIAFTFKGTPSAFE